MTTTDTIADTKLQFVVMLWELVDGASYVGPFPDVATANAWGVFYEDVLTGSPCWHTEFVDPAVPLEIRVPDAVALEPDPDPWLDQWEAPQSDTPGAAYYLLMTDSDPVHLVGPFDDHRTAFAWGKHNEETRTRDWGWQIVWMENPAAPVPLLSREQAEENAEQWPT